MQRQIASVSPYPSLLKTCSERANNGKHKSNHGRPKARPVTCTLLLRTRGRRSGAGRPETLVMQRVYFYTPSFGTAPCSRPDCKNQAPFFSSNHYHHLPFLYATFLTLFSLRCAPQRRLSHVFCNEKIRREPVATSRKKHTERVAYKLIKRKVE